MFQTTPEQVVAKIAMRGDSSYAKAAALTIANEGGWYDDPIGGPTYIGIRQVTYDAHCVKNGKPIQSVKLITSSEVADIYEAGYWRAAGCDKMPDWTAMMVFDYAVHSGPKQAVKDLQYLLDVSPDGIFGPVTKRALSVYQFVSSQTTLLVKAYDLSRLAFLRALAVRDKQHKKNLKGYEKRLKKVREAAMQELT